MSSNSADEIPTADARPPARRAWSLTTRLALFSAVSSFAILAVISIQMYFQLANHLEEQNFLYLKDETEALGQMARFPDFREAIAREMGIEHAGEEYLTHYIRLVERDGAISTMIETPNMDKILPINVFPPPETDGKVRRRVPVRDRHGLSFIATSVSIGSVVPNGKQAILQVALDVSNVENILARYRAMLAVTLVVGFLLCAFTGLVIARRGTRPIRDLTEKARRITMSTLNERLSGADWPREVNSLAGALNGMLDRLQDSFKRLYGSVENLTHKLRTPVTILRGEAEVALARERSAAELREVLESSVEEYQRLSHLIDNIVFVCQLDAGKIEPVPTPITARAEIEQVVDFYLPLAEEKGIRLACEGDACLTADPTLVRRAIACLVANALTFTPPEGSVVVSATQVEGSPPEIRVADTGCGIDEQEIPKIFDRFYRVYASRFMDPRGTGLGLPLVRTIMDLHHGSVEVLSRPGEGTTVILKFPPA